MREIETDSLDYHVLANATKAIKDVKGTICEIGTRMGGSMKVMVDALIENNDLGRNVLCVDPYGNIEYAAGDNNVIRADYTNDMRNEAYAAIYKYAYGKPVNIVMCNMEDMEFFNRFPDGYPFYNQFKHTPHDYALVFFDGPHDTASILTECKFFLGRTPIRGVWVFDDLQIYNHVEINNWLIKNRFHKIEETLRKAAYRKMT